jgi:predicted HicB family RNase H-like nuclease
MPGLKDSAKLEIESMVKEESNLRRSGSTKDYPQLNVRIPPALDRELRIYCATNRISLQHLVTEAIQEKMKKGD